MLRPIIVIAGPTATGKSDLAVRLAKQIGGVIINADSRQIYKELNIGTAKPNESSFENIPHYLFGYVSVKDNFNLYQYQKDVYSLFNTIPSSQPIILVGGTGLYIDSVIYNYKLNNQETDLNLRNNLNQLSLQELQQQIAPEVLEKLNNSERNNARRLIRIIERKDMMMDKGEEYPNKYFVCDYPEEILNQRIALRVDKMFEEGLEEEAKHLFDLGYYEYPALNSIGYREFLEYFNGSKTLEDVKNEIILNTRKYIKRQRTWFKRNSNTIWTNDFDLILKESQNLLGIS